MTTAKLVSVVGAMAMLAGAALGQGDKPLSGPTLKPDRPAGLGGQFGEGKAGDRKGPMAERVPMRLYSEAIDKLRGDAAPEGLRLSPEQDTRIAAIENDFKESMRAYIQKARQEGGNRPRQGRGAPGQNPDQMAPEGQPDRARMQELMRNAPNPTDAQVKIYASLSPAQQKFVEGEVAKGQAELQKRRSEEYMQRQLQKRKGDAGAAPVPVPPTGEGPERARRVIERLQQLPPEERDQLLRRIEEELDRRAAGGEPRRRPGGGDRKPAPKIDDVKVPPPDKL